MIEFDQGSLGRTQQLLDALALRAKVAMHNIANQNTPGFKRYEVSFEAELGQALASGGDGQDVRPTVTRDESGQPGVNNVSAVDEQATLEKVRMLNDIFTRRAGSYFQRMNRAIFGR